jgi:hypothetical protein
MIFDLDAGDGRAGANRHTETARSLFGCVRKCHRTGTKWNAPANGTGRRAHQVMQKNEARSTRARSLLVIANSCGRDGGLEWRTLEPIIGQLPYGKWQRAQELDHVVPAKSAIGAAEIEHRKELADRGGIHIGRGLPIELFEKTGQSVKLFGEVRPLGRIVLGMTRDRLRGLLGIAGDIQEGARFDGDSHAGVSIRMLESGKT